MLKHELQLQKFAKLKFKTSSKEEHVFPEQFVSEGFLVGGITELDISQLPKRAILQVRMNSCLN